MAYPSRSQEDSGLFTVYSRDDSDDQPTSAPDLKLTEETEESGVPVPPRKTLVKQEGPLSSNTTSFKQVKAPKIGRLQDDDNGKELLKQHEELEQHDEELEQHDEELEQHDEELEQHGMDELKLPEEQLKLRKELEKQNEELEKHPINLRKRRRVQTFRPIHLRKRRRVQTIQLKEPLKQLEELEKRKEEDVFKLLKLSLRSSPPPEEFVSHLPGRIGTGTLFPDLAAIKAEPDEEQVIKRIKFALENGGIPRNEYINQFICKFGKKHDVVINMCDVVSKHISSLSRKIKTVAASYIMTKPLEVVFVISHEDVVDIDLRNAVACYDVYFRNVECMSNEAEKVLYREDFQKDVLSRSQNLQVKGVINEYSKQLFSNHSNLNVISASRVKSSGFMSPKEKIISKTSIVLYVSIKGLIPFQEEPFPTRIGEYETDVMEGDFSLYHNTATDIHDDLKTGCQIHSPRAKRTGTIGPLVHFKGKQCFLTCSHVVCTKDQLQELNECGGKKTLSSNDEVLIHQPHCIDTSNLVGKVTQIIFKGGNTAGEPGMDVAVVEITDRHPILGAFPDCTGSMWEDFGFRSNSEIFYSGETCSGPDDIEPNSHVVMFGSESGFRRGIVRTTATFVRKKDCVFSDMPYTLYNQLEIQEIKNSADKPFAVDGDSGALVFLKKGNGPLIALGLFVGACAKSKQYIVTPIWDIYKEIGCEPMEFDNRPSLPRQLTTKPVVTTQEFDNFRKEMRYEISRLNENMSNNFNTLISLLEGKSIATTSAGK